MINSKLILITFRRKIIFLSFFLKKFFNKNFDFFQKINFFFFLTKKSTYITWNNLVLLGIVCLNYFRTILDSISRFKIFSPLFWFKFMAIILFFNFNFHCQIDIPSSYSERMFNSSLIFLTFGLKIIFL